MSVDSDLFEALVSLDASLNRAPDPGAVLSIVSEHLPNLLPCLPRGFAVIDEETLLPRIAVCEPPEQIAVLRELLGAAIERGLFALALRRGQPVLDELPGDRCLLLQAVATPGHLAGLMVGLCASDEAHSERLAALGLAAARIGAAHENLVLRQRITAHAQDLERSVEERTRDLAQARDRAEASSRSKSSFLATVSHELRTPLNGIIGMADLLLDDEPDPGRRERVAVMRTCAEDLLRQIDSILDLSRIEAGRLDLSPAEADPGSVVMSALRTVAPRAQEKGIELAWVPSSGFPARAVIDAGRLRQVLLNLIGNAIKFIERGEIAVEGSAERVDGQWRLTFHVRDTGPGITPEIQARLFTPFEQGDVSISRRFGGTGLGLTISRKLCEVMGGTLSVVSEAGVGSCFTAILAAGTVPPSPQTTTMFKGRAALIAGGSLAGSVAAGLARAGISVCDDQPWNLAVVDCATEEAAAVLPVLPAALPIILLTPLAGIPEAIGTILAGRAHVTITKPPDPAEVAVQARHLLQRAASGRLTSVIRAKRSEPLAAHDHSRFAGVRVIYADDQAVNRLVIDGLLRRLGIDPVLADGGEAAVGLATSREWDLVLLDCQMPEVDGFAAAARIRASGRTAPLVAVTAHAMAGDREECLTRGFDDYLAKPVRLPDLTALIDRWLGRTAPAASPPTPLPRLAELKNEVGAEVAAEVIRAMLTEGGRLAAEAVAAVVRHDLATAGKRAHALKGDAANLGLDALSGLGRALEQAAKAGDAATAATAAEQIPAVWAAAESTLRGALASLEAAGPA